MSVLRIVLQARTSSNRLPAKSLLPIGGLPLAVLCAQRLARAGGDLVLATSREPTDDELATVATEHGVRLFRGDLDDVAQRFADANADLPDDAVIVRATADNPVPDAEVVEGFVEDMEAAGTDYLGPASYWPLAHGLGVEVFRLGAFRAAVRGPLDRVAREHVTTALIPPSPAALKHAGRFACGSNPRLTVDTLDDYVVAARVFRAVENPVAARWSDLVREFATARAELDR